MRIRALILFAASIATASIVVGGLALSGILGSILWPPPRPSPASLPDVAVPPPPDTPPPPPGTPPPAAAVGAAPRTRAITLYPGDTLVRALRREGVGERVSSDVAAALARAGAKLRRLKPGDELAVTWSAEGEPAGVRWEVSPWLGYAALATDDGWRVSRIETRPSVRIAAVSGEIARSLFDAVEDVGESAALVHDLVEIFASDFDFTADTRVGDRFRLLVEKRYAGDTFVDYGRILAAQYLSDGRLLTGIGWQLRDDARWRFFDPRGRSLKKSFLKSPLEFTRITSGFSLARPHPILGGVRPHLAIDYGAPAGTPVRAVAEAVVERAGWDGGNGISVTLRHRASYETMYNHLAGVAPGVRPGRRVRQRQVIGWVGATGLATGPHLDFRVARGGQLVNPLNEHFLPGDPIAGAARAEFTRHAKELVKQLADTAPF